uniref:Minor tail protein n=1 Tax=Gordonia phage Petito TaxID=3158876 RepID=A0AAU8GR56_9CAUD
MEEYMLSTSDNPFNPFTEWDQWFAFDARAGYHTPAYLARVVRSSSELSESDQVVALNEGIDEILQFNLTGNYVKVTRPSG